MSKNHTKYFTSGPFASASVGIDFLAENLYFSYLLNGSIDHHRELEAKYEIALKHDDEEEITRVKHEIDLYNGVFNLTLTYNS